jgi:hypothetical protein
MPKLKMDIDFSEVIDEFALTYEEASGLGDRLVSAVTQQVLNNWRKEAAKGLHGTRSRYIRGLTVVERGRLENAIVLKGKFNNMIEQGISSFDMKVGFANSSKAKQRADGTGWYLTIPFRWATPDALGENEAFSGVMPKEVHAAAKRKAKGDVVMAVKPSDIPAILSKRKKVHHKTGLYEGIQRTKSLKEEANERGGGYISFRRVSDRSDKRAFFHPGFKARDFAAKALNNSNLQVTIDNEIDTYIAEIR